MPTAPQSPPKCLPPAATSTKKWPAPFGILKECVGAPQLSERLQIWGCDPKKHRVLKPNNYCKSINTLTSCLALQCLSLR